MSYDDDVIGIYVCGLKVVLVQGTNIESCDSGDVLVMYCGLEGGRIHYAVDNNKQLQALDCSYTQLSMSAMQ